MFPLLPCTTAAVSAVSQATALECEEGAGTLEEEGRGTQCRILAGESKYAAERFASSPRHANDAAEHGRSFLVQECPLSAPVIQRAGRGQLTGQTRALSASCVCVCVRAASKT